VECQDQRKEVPDNQNLVLLTLECLQKIDIPNKVIKKVLNKADQPSISNSWINMEDQLIAEMEGHLMPVILMDKIEIQTTLTIMEEKHMKMTIGIRITKEKQIKDLQI
jgi:hypothetical protein